MYEVARASILEMYSLISSISHGTQLLYMNYWKLSHIRQHNSKLQLPLKKNITADATGVVLFAKCETHGGKIIFIFSEIFKLFSAITLISHSVTTFCNVLKNLRTLESSRSRVLRIATHFYLYRRLFLI